jgi:hypothetical protein
MPLILEQVEFNVVSGARRAAHTIPFALLIVDADAHSLVREIRHRIKHRAGDAARERGQIGLVNPNLRAGIFEGHEVGEIVGETFHARKHAGRRHVSENANKFLDLSHTGQTTST